EHAHERLHGGDGGLFMDRRAGEVVAVVDAQRAARLLGERRQAPEADCRKRQSNRKPRARTHMVLPSPPLVPQPGGAKAMVLCLSTLDGGLSLSKPCAGSRIAQGPDGLQPQPIAIPRPRGAPTRGGSSRGSRSLPPPPHEGFAPGPPPPAVGRRAYPRH